MRIKIFFATILLLFFFIVSCKKEIKNERKIIHELIDNGKWFYINGEPSKYVLIGCMFIGRIGMLNLMVGLLRRLNHQFYEYPKENILIN